MKKFREYYATSQLEMPPEFQKREWAFIPFETLPNFVMYRHLAFPSQAEFKAYITGKVPANIFYSSAYYAKPSAEPMELKGWKGADLIFDIDADHLPIKNKSMDVVLRVAKKEVVRLVDIILSDFGVSKKHIKIVFSGGRGYHLHVYDERLKKLGSAERREIIDYLTLNDVMNGMRATSQAKRISKCVAAYFLNVLRGGKVNELMEKHGIKGDMANRVLAALKNKNNLKLIASGNLSLLPKSKKVKAMVEHAVSKCISRLSVHIDAPVTADVKRLIRFPGSLHGKTGLKAVKVDMNKIEEFNPLRDAIAFGEEKVKVRLKRGVRKSEVKEILQDEKIPLPGEKALVPEHAAVFLLCRGLAEYGH
jgi:DNA primase small subunit